MGQNLMNSAHKATSQAYRDGYDRIFGGGEIMENEVPNPSGFHLVPLASFPDCCQICKHLRWEEEGAFCADEIDDEDAIYDHDVALAMVCRRFERIEKWSQMGSA